MDKNLLQTIVIRPIDNNAPIPYPLLLDADPSRELVDIYLPVCEIYLALSGMEVVGIYLLYSISTEIMEIKNIAVKEELQGNGIGTLMLKDAEERAIIKGAKMIMIGTGNSSVGQLYLYQKMGFEITAVKKNFFIDNYPDELYENGIRVRDMIMLSKLLPLRPQIIS